MTHVASRAQAEGDVERTPRLLLVALFLSAEGGSRAVMEELAARLTASGWSVVTTSRRVRGGDLPVFAASVPRRMRALLRRPAAVTVPSRYLLDAMREFRNDLQLLENPLDLPLHAFRVARRERRLRLCRSLTGERLEMPGKPLAPHT